MRILVDTGVLLRTWRFLSRIKPFVSSYVFSQRHYPWITPFLKQVWRFRTIVGRDATLHYSAEIESQLLPELVLLRCQDELDCLARKFNRRLGRVSIFLFSSPHAVGGIFGPRAGGVALQQHRAIVVGDHDYVEEDIRHELVHLFAARWNLYAPPLIVEGLAVHLQRTVCGYPVNMFVRRLGNRREWSLRSLLEHDYFFDKESYHASYMIAGSFTSYLIERYGWAAYQILYCGCRAVAFDTAFRSSFGTSFEIAENDWRECR